MTIDLSAARDARDAEIARLTSRCADLLEANNRYLERARKAEAAAASVVGIDYVSGQTFQARVRPWLEACFGAEIAADRIERNHRFLEEAIELVQATGCTRSEAHQLVDYVFDRPVGEPAQEVGGVMVTLAALCLAHGLDMHTAGDDELFRIWTKVEAIRAKQAAKPKHSPLPMHVEPKASEPTGRVFALVKKPTMFSIFWLHLTPMNGSPKT